MSNVSQDCVPSISCRLVRAVESSRYVLNQSEIKIKLIFTRSHDFSFVSKIITCFYLKSFLIRSLLIFTFVLIFFRFRFTTFNRKAR